jgi:iron-sulfur cluster repair protein YtfE (RIC family)
MPETRDVIDLLMADHLVLRSLLADLDASEQPSDMRGLYLRVVAELSSHEAAEEELVFPALLAAAPWAAHEALDRIGEHGEVDELIDEMRRLSPAGHAFAKRACALVLDLGAHLDIEEEIVFPLLRDALSPDQLVALAHQVMVVKERAPAFHEHHAAPIG